MKLVGAVVVKSMSKYAKGLGKDDFKKYAKEVGSVVSLSDLWTLMYIDIKLTHLIVDKEKTTKENR